LHRPPDRQKPDGTPAVLHARDSELAESAAIENMLADLNESYNAKQGKAWGLFHPESGAFPFSGWLKEYLDGGRTSRRSAAWRSSTCRN
jgi:nucleoid-associated protein